MVDGYISMSALALLDVCMGALFHGPRKTHSDDDMWRCWRDVNYLSNNDLAYGISSKSTDQLVKHGVNMSAALDMAACLCPCVLNPRAQCMSVNEQCDA